MARAAARPPAQRKQAEQAPEVCEGKFEALLESASEAVVIVDSDGRIVFVNARTEEMFDYSRDELLGQTGEILVPEPFREVHIGHRADVACG